MNGMVSGIAVVLATGVLAAGQPGTPAPLPAGAVLFVDSGHGGSGHSDRGGAAEHSGGADRSHEAAEPRDDRGGAREQEPGDDRDEPPGPEPGDDASGGPSGPGQPPHDLRMRLQVQALWF